MTEHGAKRFVWQQEHQLAASEIFRRLVATRRGFPPCNYFIFVCLRQMFSFVNPDGRLELVAEEARPTAGQFRYHWKKLKRDCSSVRWQNAVPETENRPTSTPRPLRKAELSRQLVRSAELPNKQAVEWRHVGGSAGISSRPPSVLTFGEREEWTTAVEQALSAAAERQAPIYLGRRDPFSQALLSVDELSPQYVAMTRRCGRPDKKDGDERPPGANEPTLNARQKWTVEQIFRPINAKFSDGAPSKRTRPEPSASPERFYVSWDAAGKDSPGSAIEAPATSQHVPGSLLDVNDAKLMRFEVDETSLDCLLVREAHFNDDQTTVARPAGEPSQLEPAPFLAQQPGEPEPSEGSDET